MKRKLKLDRMQRLEMKAYICILGLLLLLILLIGKILVSVSEKEEEPNVKPVPIIRLLKNVWVTEVMENEIRIFEDGKEHTFLLADGLTVSREAREQIADIILKDEKVVLIHSKTEKVNGKVLAVDKDGVELEGIGRLSFSSGVKGYRLYNSLSVCTYKDILIGYDYVDFCVENGRICGILLVKEEAMKYIRVLIRNSNYEALFHDAVEFTCDTGFMIQYGETGNTANEMFEAGEICRIDRDSVYFQGSRVYIIPNVLTGKISLNNVSRSQGVPGYRGMLELVNTDQGIIVINEVLLEEYLYAVVPSEMPASYPQEALRAQAISARTYAYRNMLHAGYPQYGAHVDDSTSFQVYGNILEQEASTTAVKETYGQVLYTADGNSLAETYYYSTSCGIGSDDSVWGIEESKLDYLSSKAINRKTMEQMKNGDEALQGAAFVEENTFREFITNKNDDDYEANESWYRWQYSVSKIDPERVLTKLQERYAANKERILTMDQNGNYVSEPIHNLGQITDLYIEKRGAGGIAKELVIVTDQQVIKVLTEYNIRYILSDGESKVVRQDGKQVAASTLLPSAFFVIDVIKEEDALSGYALTGGGYGHGVGLSQNGAKDMANEGLYADDILGFFYRGCALVEIYQ